MRNLLLAAALGTAVLGGVPALALQGPPPPPPPGGPMMKADTNHDGIITRAEVIAEADARFAEIDANRDGKVTRDEREKHRQERRAERAERRGDAPPPPPGADGPRPPRPGKGDGVMTHAEAQERATRMFDRVDTNHDGRIDAKERAAMPRPHKMHRGGDAPVVPPAPNGAVR